MRRRPPVSLPEGAGPLDLASGEVVHLDGTEGVVLVREGCLTVHVTFARGGAAHLGTLRAGDPALALPLGEPELLRVEATAVGPVRIDVWTGAALREALHEDGIRASWTRAVEGLVRALPEPGVAPTIAAELQLPAGGRALAPPGGLVLVRVEEGEVTPFGQSAARVVAPGSLLLASGAWVVAGPEGARVATEQSLPGPEELPWAVWPLARAAVGHLLDEEDRDWARSRTAVEARAAHAELAMDEALRGIASPLAPRPAPPLADDGLLYAFGRVCAALGRTPVVPVGLPDVGRLEVVTRANDLYSRRVLLEPGWWRRDCGPLLARAGDTPLALLPDVRGYRVYEAGRVEGRPLDRGLARELAPDAMSFYVTLPANGRSGGALAALALGPERPRLVGLALAAAGGGLVSLVAPLAMRELFDTVVPAGDRFGLLAVAASLLVAAFLGGLFQLAQGERLVALESGAAARAQAALVDRLLRARLATFREMGTGELLSRVLAVSALRRSVGGAVGRAVLAALLATANLVFLAVLAPVWAGVALGSTVVLAVLAAILGRQALRIAGRLHEIEAELAGLVVQLIGGVARIRVAAAQERAFSRWAATYSQKIDLALRLRRVQDHAMLGAQLLPTVATVLFVLLVGRAAASESPGAVLAGFTAFLLFLGAAGDLAATAVGMAGAATLAVRVQPLLSAPSELVAGRAAPGRLDGSLRMQGVVFAYRADGPPVLDGLDLEVHPGEFVAIVGASGCGKSTALRLLLGFERPLAGRVSYGDQDLEDLDVVALRRQLGVVLQDTRLTAGSIFQVVAGGANPAEADVWRALGLAGLEAEVREMPMGLHTVVSEGGGNLSGGQRQRLLIARALLRRPPILLFDEATSALDGPTQAAVSAAIRSLAVTRVVIAHRLSTVRAADRIYVIERGRVAQVGRWAELAGVEGPFRRLMARQVD